MLQHSIITYLKKITARKNFWLIVITSIYLLIVAGSVYYTYTGEFKVNRNELVRIDNIEMLSRAWYEYGGKYMGASQIEFKDEQHNNYVISGARFKAVGKGSLLYDTLQYYNLAFSILTDKTGLNSFKTKSQDNIEVYDVIIGDKSFIDLSKVDDEEEPRAINLLFFVSVIYFIYLIIYFREKMGVTQSYTKHDELFNG